MGGTVSWWYHLEGCSPTTTVNATGVGKAHCREQLDFYTASSASISLPLSPVVVFLSALFVVACRPRNTFFSVHFDAFPNYSTASRRESGCSLAQGSAVFNAVASGKTRITALTN